MGNIWKYNQPITFGECHENDGGMTIDHIINVGCPLVKLVNKANHGNTHHLLYETMAFQY